MRYLRAVVYGLADSADAAAERQRETNAREGRHLSATGSKKASEASPLANQLQWIKQMIERGGMTEEEAESERAKAREKYGHV